MGKRAIVRAIVDKIYVFNLSCVYSSDIGILIDRIGHRLKDEHIQNMLIIVFKAIINYPPEFLGDLFKLIKGQQKN